MRIQPQCSDNFEHGITNGNRWYTVSGKKLLYSHYVEMFHNANEMSLLDLEPRIVTL